MKGLIVLLALLFAVTSVALAAPTLPDYKNQAVAVPGQAYACDKETARIQRYRDSKTQWSIVEVSTDSGDTFVDFNYETFHIQLAGSPETKSVSHEEFDRVLKEKSVAAYYFLHFLQGGPTDCVPAFSIQRGK